MVYFRFNTPDRDYIKKIVIRKRKAQKNKCICFVGVKLCSLDKFFSRFEDEKCVCTLSSVYIIFIVRWTQLDFDLQPFILYSLYFIGVHHIYQSRWWLDSWRMLCGNINCMIMSDFSEPHIYVAKNSSFVDSWIIHL